MLRLKSDRLQVEIAAPGTLYRGSRFDWSTFITQVTLDGQHTFCAPESWEKGEGTGGIGLCNEFGLFRPIGYEETPVGESYPKLGVGLLRRPDSGPHDFTRNYAVEPFPLTIREEGNAISLQFEPLPCRGYEVRLKKTARLESNRLDIAYELENVGTKPISTHEYNHNFLSLGEAPPGPDYSLRLAAGLTLEKKSSFLSLEDDRILWNATVKHQAFCRTSNHLRFVAPGAVWELWQAKSGIGISETVDCPLSCFALWNAPHALSPEVFIDIEVAPGEKMHWKREFRFWTQADLESTHE